MDSDGKVCGPRAGIECIAYRDEQIEVRTLLAGGGETTQRYSITVKHENVQLLSNTTHASQPLDGAARPNTK